jgi:uncharacterized protein YkwD
MKSSFFVLFFFCGILLNAQEKYPFSKWTEEMKAKANTAAKANYMTEEEKQVIFLCNLARLDGKLFADTWVKKYYDDNGVKKSSYTTSLIKDLGKVKGLAMLQPSESLFNAAKEHAVTNGKKGKEGHQNFSKRFKKYEAKYNPIGENCDYGNSKAINIVMSLLIDEGISDKGHRKNILHKQYTHVGVSIQEHKEYNWNCVMDFGGSL